MLRPLRGAVKARGLGRIPSASSQKILKIQSGDSELPGVELRSAGQASLFHSEIRSQASKSIKKLKKTGFRAVCVCGAWAAVRS